MDLKAEFHDRLYQAIEIGHVAHAEEALAAALAKAPAREVMLGLLEPVLVEVGEAWKKRATALAQGYLAAKLAERVLERVLAEESATPHPVNPWGPVVLGNIEDDFHALGRRMVGLFLKASGWEVIDLGNDVPVEEFVARARDPRVRLLGASAMMQSTARNIRRLRDALDKEGLSGRVQLVVGGAIFNLRPELVAEVGGDGTARSALLAPAVFEQLAQRSVEQGGHP